MNSVFTYSNKNAFEKTKLFYEYNLKIKQALSDMCPDSTYALDVNTLFKQIDKTSEKLEEIKEMFLTSCDGRKEYIEEKFAEMQKQLSSVTSFSALQSFYKNYIADINENFVKDVNNTISGFYIHHDTYETLYKKVNTLNEMLHLFHKEIENDDLLYENLPLVSETKNDGTSALVYGVDSELSRKINDNLSTILGFNNSRSSIILVMSLDDNNAIAMLRDIGHATVIKFEKENDNISMNYFIPKITNRYMVNENLKNFGYNKPKDDENFVTGNFSAKSPNFAARLLLFVKNIPTDENIVMNDQSDSKENITEKDCSTYKTMTDIYNEMTTEELVFFGQTNAEYVSEYKKFAEILKDRVEEEKDTMDIEVFSNASKLIETIDGNNEMPLAFNPISNEEI